jgi:hypothetical protein
VFPTVPVCFPSGGPFIVTWPLQPGDEVLLVFADRCIDSWLANGAANGPQIQSSANLHSQNDGFAIPGPHSYPNVPGNINATNFQIRTLDGTTLIEITPTGQINIVAPEGLAATSNVQVSVTVGDTVFTIGPTGVTIAGNVIVSGTVTAAAFIVPPV